MIITKINMCAEILEAKMIYPSLCNILLLPNINFGITVPKTMFSYRLGLTEIPNAAVKYLVK